MDSDIPGYVIDAVEKVWPDSGLQECVKRSNEYQLMDNAGYFIEKLRQIATLAYLPSTQDIINERSQTREYNYACFMFSTFLKLCKNVCNLKKT